MRHPIGAAAAAGLLVVAAACSKPAEPAHLPPADAPPAAASDAGAEIAADDPERGPIRAAVELKLAEVLGSPARLEVEIMRRDGDWAFVSGPAISPVGGEIDFAATKLAEPHAEGMMDGSNTLALLKREAGAWTVVEIAVGPTDVPQIAWAETHGVKPALVGLETAEGGEE